MECSRRLVFKNHRCVQCDFHLSGWKRLQNDRGYICGVVDQTFLGSRVIQRPRLVMLYSCSVFTPAVAFPTLKSWTKENKLKNVHVHSNSPTPEILEVN